MDNIADNRGEVITRKWTHAGESFERHYRQGKQVCPSVKNDAAYLFRRHVTRCPDDAACRSQRSIAELGDAKIEQMRPVVTVNQNVAGLDVPMDDVLAVRVVDGTRNLRQVVNNGKRRDRAMFRDHALNALPFDILHHDVGRAALRASGLKDCDNAGVVQASS